MTSDFSRRPVSDYPALSSCSAGPCACPPAPAMAKSLLALVALCMFGPEILLPEANAVVVTMDFQNAPVGRFTEQLIIPDGIGGFFALLPRVGRGSRGASYEIVDKSGDRELRVSERRNTSGSARLDIFHTGFFFTPISGGDYEALPSANRGDFRYRGFFDLDPVSTVEDTPIVFDRISGSLTVAGIPFLPGRELTVDVDNLLFDISPPIPGVVLPARNSVEIVQEPRYADPSFEGFSTFAMRVDSLFDWGAARLEIDLESGQMRHADQFGPIADSFELSDTGIFGPTEVIGDLSTRQSQIQIFEFTESPQFFSASWLNQSNVDLGMFDIATITLSNDANGTLTFESTYANREIITETLRIVNGRIVPEPDGLSFCWPVAGWLLFTYRKRKNKGRRSGTEPN